MNPQLPPGARLQYSFKLIAEPQRYEVYDATAKLIGVIEYQMSFSAWTADGVGGAFLSVMDAIESLTRAEN